MLTVRCARCRKKLFKYLKIGKGRVLRCYKQRISHDGTMHSGQLVKCTCGNIIGKDAGTYIAVHQQAIMYTGWKH
jgi:hypothetical protein